MAAQRSIHVYLRNGHHTRLQRLYRCYVRALVRRCATALLAASFAAILTACSAYSFTPGAPSTYLSNAPVADHPASEPLVGVAISGGGNRSALFASYALDLLGSLPVAASVANPSLGQPVSFLDSVDHISSVSGGSFAAAYFGMKGIGHYSAMLTGDTVPTPYAKFFENFQKEMNFDWEAALFGFKILTFGSNADGLAKAIDTEFLHGATFVDLDKREATGASPLLILNATHYDTGRRFVMTTIPSDAFCLDTEKLLLDVAHAPTGQEAQVDNQHASQLDQCDRSDALTPEGFDSFWNPKDQSVPSATLPLARAVATSGAFPLVIGPIAYRVTGEDELLHLIDGGVTDNSGVQSLRELYLRDLLKNPSHRDLIVSLDAGLPFNAYGTTIAGAKSPISALIDDPTRLSDIQEVRASAFREDLWDVTTYTARTLRQSNNAVTRIKLVALRPDDLNVSSLRIDTPDCHMHLDDARSVHIAARNIPTNYHLDGCDAQLVRVTACWSVHQHAADIQRFFASAPMDRRRAQSSDDVVERTHSGDGNGTGMLEARIRQMCPELVADGAL